MNSHGTLVSVVIPYLGDLDLLQRCLLSLSRQTLRAHQVLIVDNSPGMAAIPAFEHDLEIKIIQNRMNLGFAAAVNQGLSASSDEFALVLNSDVELDPSYIATLVEAIKQEPAAAGATGKLLKMTAERVLDSTGHTFYGDRRAFDRGEWEKDGGQYDSVHEVFSIPATAALYRVTALTQLQRVSGEIFDGDFFAYFEDVDLAWRLRLLGWKFMYIPNAPATHLRKVSLRPAPKVLAWVHRNRLLAIIKNDSAPSIRKHWREILLAEIRLTLFYLVFFPTVPFRVWTGFFLRLPRAIKKRQLIQTQRDISWQALEKWMQPYEYRWRLRRPAIR